MSKLTKHAEFLTDWERLLAAFAENAGDFPDMQANREKLQSILDGARLRATQQAQHVATKQALSKEIQGLFNAGQKLATAMRGIIRERYGNRSEKLAEFHMQPFRSRTQPPTLPPPEAPAPEADANE